MWKRNFIVAYKWAQYEQYVEVNIFIVASTSSPLDRNCDHSVLKSNSGNTRTISSQQRYMTWRCHIALREVGKLSVTCTKCHCWTIIVVENRLKDDIKQILSKNKLKRDTQENAATNNSIMMLQRSMHFDYFTEIKIHISEQRV